MLSRREEECEPLADAQRQAAARSANEAEAANTRARRLEGDPEALSQCSLEELRQLSEEHERAGDRVRYALTRAESGARATKRTIADAPLGVDT